MTETLKDPLGLSKYKTTQTTPKTRSFYQNQNDLIDSFLRKQKDIPVTIEYKIALYSSMFANVLLFFLQLVTAFMTGSLALYATTLDAFMDIASNTVLILTSKIAESENFLKYPTGKNKYKTAGIIVFSTLMSTLALQIWMQAIQSLISGSRDLNTDVLAVIIVGAGISIKGCLFLYCNAFKKYSLIAILAQDHFNDILFNSTGLALSFLATKYQWWVDPVGAMVIAILIIKSWSAVAFGKMKSDLENIEYIVGVTANSSFLNKCVYVALTHDPRILLIDTVKAYHSGEGLFVEVDIVLPRDMRLDEAHDVGESLQVKLEEMPEVDRAFVHLDYEVDHKPEHFKTK
jgi:cation diffusion facilitator family transporter